MDTGTIALTRAPGRRKDRARAYKVLVDDVRVAEIRGAQTLELEVPSGAHVLRLRIDWTGSPALAFTLTPGQTARFECRPTSVAPWSMVLGLLSRTRYVVLERREGSGHP